MNNIVYTGAFIPFSDLHCRLKGKRLPFVIENPHVTFEYMPEEVDTSLFGITVTLTVIGWANNGKSEGLRVEVQCTDPRLRQMAAKIEVPHITVSKTPDTPSVDTKYLSFQPITPFRLNAVFGGFTSAGRVIKESGVSL